MIPSNFKLVLPTKHAQGNDNQIKKEIITKTALYPVILEST